jgi:hypothetical protein
MKPERFIRDNQPTLHRYAPLGHHALKSGKPVRVKHCENAYPLPAVIKPENVAKILGFDHGYYEVEQGGRVFSVFMTNALPEAGERNAVICTLLGSYRRGVIHFGFP